METASIMTTLAVVGGAHLLLSKPPIHERVLDEENEVVDRTKRFKASRTHRNIRREDVKWVEEVPNNGLIGTPRYWVHLKNGAIMEVYGHVIDDVIDPRV